VRLFNFLVLLVTAGLAVGSVVYWKSPLAAAICGAAAGIWVMKLVTDGTDKD
jgi:hypothetical protein